MHTPRVHKFQQVSIMHSKLAIGTCYIAAGQLMWVGLVTYTLYYILSALV